MSREELREKVVEIVESVYKAGDDFDELHPHPVDCLLNLLAQARAEGAVEALKAVRGTRVEEIAGGVYREGEKHQSFGATCLCVDYRDEHNCLISINRTIESFNSHIDHLITQYQDEGKK